jgi:hypothetical protein
MAAAAIEHRMIGHISGPPARTISHIRKLSSRDPKTAKAASYRRATRAQGNCVAGARAAPPGPVGLLVQ